jgi:non-canonical poly(A) RNA polymerase PAPD5/7
MSQSNQSEQFRILKQYIEQKDFDNFNRFLDNNEISKKTLNSILCFTLQNYRSNYEMTDYIQLLIEKGAEQNSMFHNKTSNQGPRIDEKDNVSILMYACIYADIRLIDLIVTEKNINLKDKNGKNALFYVLSDKGDNPDVIDALLYHNIDVNCIGKVDMGDKTFENHTALSLAATKNMVQSFKILIDKGSNPNFKIIQTGDTILHIAVKKGNLEMVKLLLDTNKIKFEEKNKENKTALELAMELSDKSIYNLIKEKIEEGNRQGDIVAKELLTEEKKNLNKKQNEIKNLNLLNEFNKNINQNKIEKNNNKKIIDNIKEKIYEKRRNNKKRILDKFLSHNLKSTANLEITYSFLNDALDSNQYLDSEQIKENIPILKIDLFSNEFNEYKDYFNKKQNEEKEKIRILEEENLLLKKNIEAMTENNKILSNKINEIEFQFKDIEIKQQLEIIELKKKISLLEQENNNDKVIISELNKQINMKGKEIIKNNENQNNINIIINNDNNQRKINYLNKKFINYNYNFEHIQDKEKNNYIINCLSKDISEFESFVTMQIKSSSNIFQDLLKNVEKAVNECIPDYQVHLYGSHATNLCLPWSDLDVVLIPKNLNMIYNKSENNRSLLSKLYENLKNQKWVKDILYISNASIPIIKIYSIGIYNNIPIDISIQEETHFGLKCVELVKQYMNQYESLKPLVLSIKNILKRANLNDPYKGGISSYGLILMIIYFLKQQSFAGIDISKGENNCNLGHLFYDFLVYYSFDFEFGKNIIYVKNTPSDLEALKYQNISLGPKLIIIDPLNPSNNVAKSCFQNMGIKMAFIISLKSLLEDCECGCHYSGENKEYSNLSIEHCFLKRIFNAVKRYTLN